MWPIDVDLFYERLCAVYGHSSIIDLHKFAPMVKKIRDECFNASPLKRRFYWLFYCSYIRILCLVNPYLPVLFTLVVFIRVLLKKTILTCIVFNLITREKAPRVGFEPTSPEGTQV
jgi:hypothetical protein